MDNKCMKNESYRRVKKKAWLAVFCLRRLEQLKVLQSSGNPF